MTAHPLTAQIPGRRDRLGRLRVDAFLRVVGVPDVYAAGDTAAARTPNGHPVLQSCQHAIPLGKTAGHNAAADLLDRPLASFATTPYVTCVDLGPAGAIFTTGFERAARHIGAAAKDIKRAINTELIYPPVDDAHALLEQAEIPPSVDHRRRLPRPEHPSRLRGPNGPTRRGEVSGMATMLLTWAATRPRSPEVRAGHALRGLHPDRLWTSSRPPGRGAG